MAYVGIDVCLRLAGATPLNELEAGNNNVAMSRKILDR